MKLKLKTRPLFLIVSLYIISAFSWWVYSLISLREQEAAHSKTELEARAEFVKLELVDNILTILEDSPAVSFGEINQLYHELPTSENFQLTIEGMYSAIHHGDDPYYYLKIVPVKKSYNDIDEFYQRKVTQYLLEGIVLIAFLVWGMVVLFRNIESRIKLNQQQNNFLLSVTHELKTPVAAVKLLLQTLQRRKFSEEVQTSMIADAVEDTDRLEELIENILLATRMETHSQNFVPEKINFSEMIEAQIQKIEKRNYKNQKFIKHIAENISTDADAMMAGMAIDNLLSNAVKYSPEKSEIIITLKKENEFISVQVEDHAPQIPDEMKRQIFEKFYRLGNENTRKAKGTGLGLYIVKQVAEMHGGQAFVSNSRNGGNVFTIQFAIL